MYMPFGPQRPSTIRVKVPERHHSLHVALVGAVLQTARDFRQRAEGPPMGSRGFAPKRVAHDTNVWRPAVEPKCGRFEAWFSPPLKPQCPAQGQ